MIDNGLHTGRLVYVAAWVVWVALIVTGITLASEVLFIIVMIYSFLLALIYACYFKDEDFYG